MDRHRIAIVIPAFNEAETIRAVVTSASDYGAPIVVDDGSIDDTAKAAAAAGAHVVRQSVNSGYDEALNAGFQHAARLGCEYVLTMDADGQHDPVILRRLIESLDGGADVVTGTRDKRQRIAEYFFAWLTSFKWGIRDPLCGLKGYRMAVYDELGHFDCYGSIGTELILFASRRGKRIVQFPIATRARRGAPRFGTGLRANGRIFRALGHALRPCRASEART
jgi:glycosyltransferase involved in cell wall biosynthesis